MAYRFILGCIFAASLSGCFDGSSSGTTDTASATVAADSGTSSTQIIVQGQPAASATVGVKYTFVPTVSASYGVTTFAIEGQPSWTTFDTATGTLSGTPAAGDVGLSGDITIIASNGTLTGTVGPFTIRVNAETQVASDLPVIGGNPATSVTAGQTYIFQPSAGDPSGRALTFSIRNNPSWATFSTLTGELSGTPTAAQVGTYSNIAIVVSDGTGSAALPLFAITVTASTSGAPVISGKAPTSVVAGQAYTFLPSATDPASKSLTFSITHAPSWATFSTKTGQLSGTPTSAQIGVDSDIIISVSNGTASAALAPFTITVTAPTTSDTPVIGGKPPTAVVAGQAYTFQPTATDPAGHTLTFSIANRPSWASFNTTTGQLSGTPPTTAVGSFPSVGISVSNGTQSATLAPFTIVVSKPAAAASPTISGTPPTSVVSGNTYHFTPTTSDPSGGVLSFSIKNAPSWATFNATTGELSGTPTAADVGTYSNITISVSDGTTSASLPAFPIAVTQIATGSATLTWSAPTQNTDGSSLTNLAGYRIYYGTSATALSTTVQIANPGTVTYVVSNLSPGTWYFSMSTYSTANVESAASAVVSTTID
ncbi:MAG: putative Ig domain-containing protein [Pseudomonadota bacterium]|nr:putative Ig domain-containing protein [Pseudomonadota bacterium]